MDAFRHLAMQYKYGTIGNEYIGDSGAVAAYRHSPGGSPSPYANWQRFNRGRA